MEQKPIEIEYEPRKWARTLHTTDKKRAVLIIHRQGGKTTACLHHLIFYGALVKPDTKYAYIAPTYKQGKAVAWDNLKKICRPLGRHVKFNEVDLSASFSTGSKITIFGADNPDSLRGLTLHGIVLDEYSQHPGNIWTEILEPTLATTNGYAIWIGTPKGKNQLYELYKIAENHPEEYLLVYRTIKDTIDEETGKTVDNLKKALEGSERSVANGLKTQDEHLQEYFCSFESSVKGAYYAEELFKARSDNRIRPVPYDPSLLVYTVWDLGIGDATAIGFYQKDQSHIRMIDFYENQGQGLPHYINVLRNKNYTYGTHFAPHDIQQREFTTGKSRLEIARDLGISFNIIPNLAVEDGINAGRLVFNRMLLDSDRTAAFVDKIARYHKKWDDKRGIFLDRPDHDDTSHAADVHRYMALIESEFNPYLELEDFALYSTSYK